MGDRANVGIRGTDGNTIFLYLHWGGLDRHEIVANAITHAMNRDSDESYFTRIFVSRVIDRDWDRETGVGMSINKLSSTGEDEYNVPVYDFANKTISLHKEKWDKAGGYIDLTPLVIYNRDEYLAEYAVKGVGAYA
jgi:hypothetical protein